MEHIIKEHYEIRWKELQEKFKLNKRITSIIVDFSDETIKVETEK